MASVHGRKLLLAVTSLVAALAAAGGVAIASSSHHARRGMSLAQVVAHQGRSGRSRVIVVLSNQFRALPPSKSHIRARRAALSGAQQPLESAVRKSGGTVHYSYDVLNAFAATASKAEIAKLRSNPAVAEVLPDALVRNPAAGGATAGGLTYTDKPMTKRAHLRPMSLKAYKRARAADDAQQVCPANPSNPIIAPEGMNLINAPQARALGVDGSGVKVAFVAEGIDVNNPDLTRPNGQPVIIDYRDFSGDGPNAVTGGAEAFGDASTIAAQGNVTYDLSKFANPVNAGKLPTGCNIKLVGVSPGASLVAMKAFGNSNFTFTSNLIQGMSWAVAVDHVNVLNESFGSDPLPASTQDVTAQFNRLAVAAGTFVTTSSGDQGTANTIGSPADDAVNNPGAIAAGATTQWQGVFQTLRGGTQLSSGSWINDNIAEFSSGGFTQAGSTLDLVAPGNESFEACTASATYQNCKNYAGQPSNISTFGGTSESAPMTAGVAALMIQAYRQTHGGSSPSPALIKSIIDSNTTDLQIPSNEQGGGELNALADVQAAMSVNGGTPTGSGRLISPNQLDFAQQPGTRERSVVHVTNVGAKSQTYTASVQKLGAKLSSRSGVLNLTPAKDPTFVDNLGVTQGYQEIHFNVPSGAQRIDASLAHPNGTETVNMILLNPTGAYTAYTYHPADDNASYAHIDVRAPQAGTWTAIFFTPTDATGYTGPVNYRISTSKFISGGSVSPSSVQLAPGQSAALQVSLPTPMNPGDYSRNLRISDSSGDTSVVPVVSRSLVPLRSGTGSYSGTLTGGDGDGAIAQEQTFAFNIPAGTPNVHVTFNMPNNPNTDVLGFIVSPTGQALGQSGTVAPSGAETMDLSEHNPMAGRWRFVISTLNPVGGTTASAPFSGTVSLTPYPISASRVPNGTTIPAGAKRTAKVRITNSGLTALSLFIDPRLQRRKLYPLTVAPGFQATGLTLPLSPTGGVPVFMVPTETNLLLASAHASAPVTFDWGFGNPDLESTSVGNNAFGAFAEPEVTPGEWFLTPSLVGPFTGPASGTADTGMAGNTRVFDDSVTTNRGDALELDVNPNAAVKQPINVRPGQTRTVRVTFAPTAARGTTVSGDLFVDDYTGGGAANELGAIPYQYTVGK